MTTTEKKSAHNRKMDWINENHSTKHEVGDLVFWYACEGRFTETIPTKIYRITEAKPVTYGNGFSDIEYKGIEIHRFVGNKWIPVKKAKECYHLYSGRIRPLSETVINEMVEEHTKKIEFLNSLLICKPSSLT